MRTCACLGIPGFVVKTTKPPSGRSSEENVNRGRAARQARCDQNVIHTSMQETVNRDLVYEVASPNHLTRFLRTLRARRALVRAMKMVNICLTLSDLFQLVVRSFASLTSKMLRATGHARMVMSDPHSNRFKNRGRVRAAYKVNICITLTMRVSEPWPFARGLKKHYLLQHRPCSNQSPSRAPRAATRGG